MSSTILVVDDEKNIRRLVQLTLEKRDYKVILADSGEDALRQFGQGTTIDLVLLDYMMPELNGIEVLQRMVKIKPDIKVILVSAYSSIDVAIEAMNLGATDFLRKPFTPQAIADLVNSVLTRSSKDAPITSVCREFTRTNINGYNFEVLEQNIDENFLDFICYFEVFKGNSEPRKVKVLLPAYMQELILAYIDADDPPCGIRLWEAACEEKLASHLWQYDEVPRSGQILIEDLTPNMKLWLDSIMTVSLSD